MKIYYDVLTKKENNFESRAFEFNDIVNIIKKSFMDHETFTREVFKKVPDDGRETRKEIIETIYNFYGIGFKDQYRKMIVPVLTNDNRLLWSDLFKWKVLNFGKAYNKKPMFDFYINNRSDFLLYGSEEENKIRHENHNIPDGNLIIRCYNYVKRDTKVSPEVVDIDTKINQDDGLVDSQNRYYPPIVDQFINKNVLRLGKNEIYFMSPLLVHFFIIYDKILLLSKQKSGFFYPRLLKNTIDSSFNDCRIVNKMNKKYQLINNSFIRIVPSLITKDFSGAEIEISRAFKYVWQKTEMEKYSYGDVKSGSSGSLGSNKINLKDYKRAVDSLELTRIIFTKEENTTAGLFAFNDPSFIKIISDINKNPYVNQTKDLNNHMFTIDYENEIYKTAINGPASIMLESPDKVLKVNKKFNQRLKHNNSRTYPYDSNDMYNIKMINKQIDGHYQFHRDVNYMNDEKKLDIANNYGRNALVAFVSSNVDLPPVAGLIEKTSEELLEWFYSLRGVACEGFFTKDFLRQRMLVRRTERLKVDVAETDINFQKLVETRDLVDKTFAFSDKDKFLVRSYMECSCGGKIVNAACKTCNNPNPLTGEVRDDFWVDFSKNFDFVKLIDIRKSEDGINIYLEYSIPLANSRFRCDELTKAVPVETSQYDIGFVKQIHLGDIEMNDLNVPLDGIYYGLGSFKSGINGIPFTVLRLYNAMKGEIKYSSSDCVNQTNEVNEFLKSFKKSVVRTKVYDKEKKAYIHKDVEAWVGLVSVSPTEVSQEFNKSRSEIERSFSKVNYRLNNDLGFHDLNKALSNESNLTTSLSSKYRNELFKIANIHSSIRPLDLSTDKASNLAVKHDTLIKGIPVLNNQFKSKCFDTSGFKRYSLKVYVSYSEYKRMIEEFPLFKEKIFEKGFAINCILNTKDQTFTHGIDKFYNTIYFPPKDVLLQMFEAVGDNNIRINDLLYAYISIFESFGVSSIGNYPKAGDGLNIYLIKGRDENHTFASFNGKILAAVNDILFDKKGLLNQITNIAVPRFMSKQLTDIDCPYDVAIISNNYEYKKLVSKILSNLYPDKEQDWSTPEMDKENNVIKEAGWCWVERVYGFAVREPNLFSKQNLNVKVLWSSYKADMEYKAKLGVTFHQKHPGTKGIYLNPVFIAFNLEGDVDGDTIFIAAPKTKETQNELFNVFEKIKEMKFFDVNNENKEAKFVRQTYLVPSLNYLLSEAKNLNFKLDTLSIGYSEVTFKQSVIANFDAASNKENLGFLTTSFWLMSDFTEFYMFNYNKLKERGYEIPELSDRNKYELLFIFQYLLAQQNGARAMKDIGSYGKITVDALATNKEFQVNDNVVSARSLLNILISEYKEENAKEGIEVDFSETISKLYQILDNMLVSRDKYRGFGYVLDESNKIFSYRDSRWSYGEKSSSRNSISYIDCTTKYDSYFVDFMACFLLINGRDPSVFIKKFGYDKTLQALEFKNKPHLGTPLLSFVKEVF